MSGPKSDPCLGPLLYILRLHFEAFGFVSEASHPLPRKAFEILYVPYLGFETLCAKAREAANGSNTGAIQLGSGDEGDCKAALRPGIGWSISACHFAGKNCRNHAMQHQKDGPLIVKIGYSS
jgi:hypothetical protein